MSEEVDVFEGSLAFHGATVDSAGEELISLWAEGRGENAVKRVLGCAIMYSLPEESVNEALFSLRDIWEFYQTTQRMLPPPVATRRYVGKIVGISQRPDLVIEE